MKFRSDMYSSLRRKMFIIADLLTFLLAPPLVQNLVWFFTKLVYCMVQVNLVFTYLNHIIWVQSTISTSITRRSAFHAVYL